jgi:hypothetical protein
MPARPPFDADGLHWPGILADIADAAGPMAAYRVAEAKGGSQAYFPYETTLTDDHWLVRTCGWEAARRIARRVGAGKALIPLGPLTGNRASVRRAIRDGLDQGLSGMQVARLTGVDHRTVRRHRNAPDRDDQHSLI